MLKFLINFLKVFLLPAITQATANAVINQIEESVYGPRRGPRPMYNTYRRPAARTYADTEEEN
jgi:hypothetical protein